MCMLTVRGVQITRPAAPRIELSQESVGFVFSFVTIRKRGQIISSLHKAIAGGSKEPQGQLRSASG
jgi:hypothetical protein